MNVDQFDQYLLVTLNFLLYFKCFAIAFLFYLVTSDLI